MLSRVADAIYWVGRYIERAENIARFVEVNHHLMLDLQLGEEEQWQPLVTVTGDAETFRARYDAATRENVVRFLLFDERYPNSVVSATRMARENARSIREVISSEMWEQINEFYHFATAKHAPSRVRANPHKFLTELKRQSHLFTGLSEVTMAHTEGWHFMRLGQMLERADKTSRILDVKYFIILPRVEDVGTPYDSIQWAAVLKSASALEMYRKRFQRIAPGQVAEFLILDAEFPRAIRHCVGAAQYSLHAISKTTLGTVTNEAERRLGRLRADLEYTKVEEILARGLHEYLDDLQSKLNDVSDAVFSVFFALRPQPARATAVPS